MVAHRTSPTNIGLYLLSAACARQFGWIGTQDLLARLEATLSTLLTLQRHRGHFMNWYDTQTCAPLLPMYVSTVDSGNLSAHLLAVAQACLEIARAPYDDSAARHALRASRTRLQPLLAQPRELYSGLLKSVLNDVAMARLLAMADPLSECQHNAAQFELVLTEASRALATLVSAEPITEAHKPSLPGAPLTWLLADHLATLHSVWRDLQAHSQTPSSGAGHGVLEAQQRLLALAHDFEQLAWQADFRFLYHPKRHLLHIGYRVAEQELDASFYDLLASESRLTSLLAIAKGDVPVSHWCALGRLFYANGADAALRSWSGSMFEYLMPTLVLDEPHGSVLQEACKAALTEQITFAKTQEVPWGISESAYAGSDHTLAYQYAPQGVPRLALRRTPLDELVIAPYATALAAQISPHLACGNFIAMKKMALRARYGFIEAIDFTPARQSGSETFTPVETFMAHHQGMSIVALANVLLGGVAQRWGMANAHIEAVSSLLHERVPREISVLFAPPSDFFAPSLRQRRRAPGLLRDIMPGEVAVEPTHLLSNGRYHVTLRANGAGWSRWGQIGITRGRDDALRDAFGSFFYVRGGHTSQPVSITQHPAPDPRADYRTTYHADRVCFDAVWPELQAHTTVWISPEDDIEFRQIELRNLSEQTIDIELLSAFEVTLSDPRADEAHPAFTNLFVRAQWLAADQALLFERQPRLPTEQRLLAAHFLAETDPQVVDIRLSTDRQHWRGRNRDASHPLASFDPALQTAPEPQEWLDTGLDPVCALAVTLRMVPGAKAQLTFATAASDNPGTLHAVIDKYRQASHIKRASLMSATLTGIRLRALRISAEDIAAMQTLTTALVLSLTRPLSTTMDFEDAATDRCDRRTLWRFGISGDRPIILISAGVPQGLGLLRSISQILSLWSWGGVACDLVMLNAEPTSYLMTLQREMMALRDRHISDNGANSGTVVTSFHVLRSAELSNLELSTLQNLARIRLHADGRPLKHHVQEWVELHEQAFEQRHEKSSTALPMAMVTGDAVSAPPGEFEPSSGEFRFDVSTTLRPLRPWINVLSNAAFGAQLSEAGGGYSWAVNSRLNQLTAWSNDPVADPSCEWFLLQDRKTMEVWSLTPNAGGDAQTIYSVSHGQGYSVMAHRRGDVEVTATWCVDTQTAVKQVHVRLVNHGHKTRHLRLIGMAEWMMGANRTDRNTTRTALYRPQEQELTVLLCTQREHASGFGDGTAFFSLTGSTLDTDDWTCDRREFFDARGRLVLPDHFGQRSGDGLDPCAALSTRIHLRSGALQEKVFLLGYGKNADAACQLACKASAVAPPLRLEQVTRYWDHILGATQVKTPDPLLDAMVNRWLLYQTVACRMWAKAGFYQAGGATGFRDQLQDAMALAWAAPEMLREQILLGASRQFPEGDVQHWWHAPQGAGVRTHFSDDLLWLAYATHHYLRATGDTTLLDQRVPFIEGAAIPPGAEDAYYTPSISPMEATVYEHAARAIDRSLRVGEHGLPLMGSGDWNDGMNRVGIEGRGESVWLGWFLCQLVVNFAPLAYERGDEVRAQQWESAARGWTQALNGTAWDGQWFKRAFFDDGQALGSQANPEARIDLIAQAWSVLSQAAPPTLQHMAMAAVETHLVDHEAGLIRLLDPPLAHATPSAGYIQAYPPGVRENGGQYSHAGVWALMAQAEIERELPGSILGGDTVYRYFTYLSPAHRSRHPVYGAVYGLEPYVMAGDVYSQPPYVGRGGWSWYTGAAAWLHRAAIESLFGLQQRGQTLTFKPCLPSSWHQSELTLVRDGRTLRFIFIRDHAPAALAATAQWHAELLRPGQALTWTAQAAQTCFVIPLLEWPAPAHAAATSLPPQH